MVKEHFLEQHDPERKDFQIDRIILFSDAVFAIAITLLVIEIKAPEVELGAPIYEQLNQLASLIPKFIGFIISFFVIAVYWRSHHRMYGFVNRYTDRLIWLNFWFLFFIVLMPFSSAYYSENTGFAVPFYFYYGNIIATGIVNYLVIRYVFNSGNKIVEHEPTVVFKKLFIGRSVTIPFVFTFGILIAPVFPWLAKFTPVLIWPVFILLRRYYGKKYGKVQMAHSRVAEKSDTD